MALGRRIGVPMGCLSAPWQLIEVQMGCHGAPWQVIGALDHQNRELSPPSYVRSYAQWARDVGEPSI